MQTTPPSPAFGYSGPDSFTFKANDGAADSNLATVSITVNAVASPTPSSSPTPSPETTAPVAAGSDAAASVGDVGATFSHVTTPGVLTVQPLDAQHNPEANFRLVRGGYYNISTTAGFTGPVTITVSVDTVHHTITGVTDSFSDFEIVEPADPVINTPASSEWSLAVLALVAFGLVAWRSRRDGRVESD